LDAVAGVTTIIDMTAEDVLQRNPRFLTRAKSFETFFSFGPELVTLDEVGDLSKLVVRTLLDGAVHRENTVANMMFSPAYLVSFFSHVMTLEPGDVISTGTPGAAVLRDGCVVGCEIDRRRAHEQPGARPQGAARLSTGPADAAERRLGTPSAVEDRAAAAAEARVRRVARAALGARGARRVRRSPPPTPGRRVRRCAPRRPPVLGPHHLGGDDAGRHGDHPVPVIMSAEASSRPQGVTGAMSPYPTVVSVTIAQYIEIGMLSKPLAGSLDEVHERPHHQHDRQHERQEHGDLGPAGPERVASTRASRR
jgi:hypothetical protein